MSVSTDTAAMSEERLASLSDDEIMNLGPEAFGSADTREPETEDAQDSAEEATDDTAEPDADDTDGDDGEDDESSASDESDSPDSDEAGETGSVDDETDTDTEETAADDDEKDEQEDDTSEVDYRKEYEALFAPFRANGKEMRVETAEEARTLMQMGANYNKKMAALKPHLKTIKLLENNNLLEPEKLSYLIDLEKKNPQAIQKLIKDSGLDPLDIDTEKESEYKPETYTVDDRELELDAVLDDIQDTPTYSQTIDLVSNKWDGPSKRVVAEQPQLLKVINDHMASGVYDRISTEMERQRAFGRLTGLSDLDAYRTVGDELQAKGAFDDLFTQAPAQEPARKTVVAKPKAEDGKRKSKKRAASSTRTAPKTSGASADFNPLALSDDEFEKLINEKLM